MSISVRPMTKEDLAKMVQEHQELNPERPIRPDIRASLESYAYAGRPLGDFLTAVVENNLFEALSRADSYNRATIFQIMEYIATRLPISCWGSPERVREHLESFRSKSEGGEG